MSVKKLIFVALLLMGCGNFAIAQAYLTKPKLGVLPFTGGAAGEGEQVVATLSAQDEVVNAFTLLQLSDEARTKIAEQLFSMSVFTDSEVMAGIGRTVGADYVVSGHIRRIGDRSLVVATAVSVDTYELVGGFYRTYRNALELQLLVPAMSRALADAIGGRQATERRPVLAASPFSMFAGSRTGLVDTEPGYDTETLAELLVIELAGTGLYSVVPRPATIAHALVQWEYRLANEEADSEEKLDRLLEQLLDILYGPPSGQGDRGAVETVGRVVSADLVLSIEVDGLDEGSSFSARIFRTENAELVGWAGVGFALVDDGVDAMSDVAILLTDPDGAARRIAAANRKKWLQGIMGDPARFWSVGVSVASSFPVDPMAIGSLNVTLAPFAFSFLRLGLDVGFLSRLEDIRHHSFYPFVQYAFFYPFSWGAVYAGAGGGYLNAQYSLNHVTEERRIALADLTFGVSVFDGLDVSYTLRTDFASANGKFSLGYVHRFGSGGR